MVGRQDPREFDATPYFDTEMRQMQATQGNTVTRQVYKCRMDNCNTFHLQRNPKRFREHFVVTHRGVVQMTMGHEYVAQFLKKLREDRRRSRQKRPGDRSTNQKSKMHVDTYVPQNRSATPEHEPAHESPVVSTKFIGRTPLGAFRATPIDDEELTHGSAAKFALEPEKLYTTQRGLLQELPSASTKRRRSNTWSTTSNVSPPEKWKRSPTIGIGQTLRITDFYECKPIPSQVAQFRRQLLSWAIVELSSDPKTLAKAMRSPILSIFSHPDHNLAEEASRDQ